MNLWLAVRVAPPAPWLRARTSRACAIDMSRRTGRQCPLVPPRAPPRKAGVPGGRASCFTTPWGCSSLHPDPWKLSPVDRAMAPGPQEEITTSHPGYGEGLATQCTGSSANPKYTVPCSRSRGRAIKGTHTESASCSVASLLTCRGFSMCRLMSHSLVHTQGERQVGADPHWHLGSQTVTRHARAQPTSCRAPPTASRWV